MLPRLAALSILVPVLLSSVAAGQAGSVTRTRKLGAALGGFGGTLASGDRFGEGLAPLGDLDGDGIGDLAVGASGCDDGGVDRGAIWILFLNADGSVRTQSKISQTSGGFTGTLTDHGLLGERVINVGDLDADGVPELAALSGRPSRLWVLFLKPDGTLKAQTVNLFTSPVFVPATTPQAFHGDQGFGGLEALGDLDGDGLGDLALGAPYDADGGGIQTGALWIAYLNGSGAWKAAHKISQTQGGFAGTLHANDAFGASLAQIDDLDGDGNRELLVSAPVNGPGTEGLAGSSWVLYLDANELVRGQQQFTSADYGVGGAGEALEFARLGDLDGDGIDEVALGLYETDFPGGPPQEGGLGIAHLKADGSVAKRLRISHLRGGLGSLTPYSSFGFRFAPLGDLDGNGEDELAVSLPLENQVWILSLQASAFRNGSGVNPPTLTQTAEPVFGATWSLSLDCSAHAPGAAVLLGYARPSSGVILPVGEALVTGQRFFRLVAAHASGPVPFASAVPPPSLALIDLPIFVQGACSGAPGISLSNALDVLVGR